MPALISRKCTVKKYCCTVQNVYDTKCDCHSDNKCDCHSDNTGVVTEGRASRFAFGQASSLCNSVLIKPTHHVIIVVCAF